MPMYHSYLIRTSISQKFYDYMDFPLRFIPKLTNSLSILNKLYAKDRLPAAAVFDRGSQDSPYCAICLNDIRGGDRYRKLPDCGHCFHAPCVDAWFASHSTCPLCRSQVPEIISLNQNHYQWDALLSNILLLFRNFLEKMSNPLNDELASMLCDNIRCNF